MKLEGKGLLISSIGPAHGARLVCADRLAAVLAGAIEPPRHKRPDFFQPRHRWILALYLLLLANPDRRELVGFAGSCRFVFNKALAL